MPEAHDTIVKRLTEVSTRSQKAISEVETTVSRLMKENGIGAAVKGRTKKPYSVWRKMDSKSIALEQLSDIFGFRVIVNDVGECYRALGLIHTTWPMVPGRFKDYISVPKQNDYRSLHTTVVGPARQRVDCRSARRTCTASRNSASQRMRSTRTASPPTSAGSRRRAVPLPGCARRSKILAEGDNPEEFLEHTKLELFHDQVFCFTPKGA